MGGCDFFGNEETNDTQATLCLQSVANLNRVRSDCPSSVAPNRTLPHQSVQGGPRDFYQARVHDCGNAAVTIFRQMTG